MIYALRIELASMPWGSGVKYIVLRDEPQPLDQTDLNVGWRCAKRVGGGTFQKRGTDRARGWPVGPLGWLVGQGVAPQVGSCDVVSSGVI